LDNRLRARCGIVPTAVKSISDKVCRDMTAIVVSEHSMNETILASAGDPVGLTLTITPWPHFGPLDSTGMSGLQSRVDSAAGTLTLSIVAHEPQSTALGRLRLLMQEALPILRRLENATATLTHSGVILDSDQLDAALADWTDETVPVHSLIAFDFAVSGAPPGACSIGLAALIGQEIIAWPPDETLRLVCARMVVRLAHDMLLHGPIMGERVFPAPDAPQGQVTLVPHNMPEPVVQIRF
jgi:hypothetical protein